MEVINNEYLYSQSNLTFIQDEKNEEFIHNPNLQVTPAYTVLLFDDNSEVSERIVQNYKATRKVSDRVYSISSHPSLLADEHALSVQHIKIANI